MPTRLLVLLSLLVAGAALAADPPAKPKTPERPKVGPAFEDIQARLYYENQGAVDPRDLTTGKVTLWNTIIAEGEAKNPSSTVLVEVVLTRPPEADMKATLRVTARADGKTLREVTFDLDRYTREGRRLVLPVIVTDVGCDPVEVTAVLTRGTAVAKRVESIPFACGE